MNVAARQAALGRALQGDREALGELLDSYRPYLRAIAAALGSDRMRVRVDDSDLIQDALLEAHRSFGRFRGSCIPEFVTWLRRIAVRSAGRAVRAHLAADKRRAGRERRIEGLDRLLIDSGTSPSSAAVRHEESARLAELIGRLPADMQRVLLGRHVTGLSHAELAKRLNRTEVAVRVLYVRALGRLKELYQAGGSP